MAAIDGGRVTRLRGGDLHMQGADWPGATNNVLFVRECYEPLFSNILGELRPALDRSTTSARERRFMITGQPGIGKTVLIWLIIFRLRTEQPDRAIIYVDKEKDCYIIVPGEPVRACPLSDLVMLRHSPELAALNPVFLCDSYIPPTPPCPCVVVSSPGRLARLAAAHSEEFKQHYIPRLYVPVPTEAEVLRMREVAFPHQSEAMVRQRMALWGPNPRYVLVRTSKDDQQEAWDLARSATLQDLLRAAKAEFFGGRAGDKGDAPHRLMMERCKGQDAAVGSPESDMRNRAFWRRGVVVFASSPMVRYVVDRMVAEQRWNTAFLVDATANIGCLEALRGVHFEQVALAALSAGGRFKVRRLLPVAGGGPSVSATAAQAAGDGDGLHGDTHQVDDDGLEDDDGLVDDDDGRVAGRDGKLKRLALHATDSLLWADTDRLAQLRDREATLVPTDRNEAGLDGFLWVPSLNHHVPVDATISKRHGLHQSGLFSALSALGWSSTDGWPRRLTKKHPDPKARRSLQVPYYWVVPAAEFNAAGVVEQPVKPGTGNAAVAKRLVQFAVCIPSRMTVDVARASLANVPTPEQCLAQLEAAQAASTRASQS